MGARPVSVQPVYDENGIRTGQFDVMFLSMEDVQKAVVKNNAFLRKFTVIFLLMLYELCVI